MKKQERIIYGLLITILIFFISTFFGNKIHFGIDFIPNTFATHSIMLLLSVVAISFFKKNIEYHISVPKLVDTLKPILFGVLTSIVVNISMTLIAKISGNEIERMEMLTQMSTLQVFVFIFIYASIVEELLFRGFLLNLLKPFKENGIIIFKRKISTSVIISALMFGLAHLILFTTNATPFFVLKIVLFTTMLGLVAGYYQEKYNNNAYAILVHMAGNSLTILAVVLMHLNN